MRIIKKIISILIFFLIKIKIFKLPKKSLRVLMFHNISDIMNFKNQINLLKKDWKFINPDHFYKILDGKKKINGRYLLLTFDDGFKSNIYVAEKILKKLKLKAIFFVPIKFVLMKDKKLIKKFIQNNLKVNSVENEMKNLNLKDLKKLKKMDFVIGAHTYSHKNLKKINDKKILNYEIIQSANKLQKLLNIKIDNFSFNFGRLNDISYKSLLLSKKRFKYIFTAIRGENLNEQKIIFRDNVIPEDGTYELYTYLSGYLDFIYSKEKKIIEKIYHKIF